MGLIAIKQLALHCGPACIAMVLAFYGQPVDQAVIGKEFRVVERGGCSSQEIAQYLRNKGLQVEISKHVSDLRPLEIIKTGKHFMLLTGKEGDYYILIEPLGGMFTKRDQQWFDTKVDEVIRISKKGG